MTKKLVLVVACALIDADDRILLAQRPQGKSMAGLWEFPGGKVRFAEQVESHCVCVHRFCDPANLSGLQWCGRAGGRPVWAVLGPVAVY